MVECKGKYILFMFAKLYDHYRSYAAKQPGPGGSIPAVIALLYLIRHMIRLLTLLLCLFFSGGLYAQPFENMTNLGVWHDPTLELNRVRYNDVWGYAAVGREYGLIGSRAFVIIIDVTDPANAVEVARLNDSPNTSSTWRDIKTFGSYAYAVSEAPEGLQVIDLGNLPVSASVIKRDTNDFTTCHNIFIDDSVSPAKLYAFGTNTRDNGYFVYSLADPANPVLLAESVLTGGYAHDGYVINDTLYANHERRGMYVHDVSVPANPVELGILSNYVENGYNHSSWRSPDGKYVVMCDETNDTGVKIVDVEDPLDMEVTGLFRSTLLAPDKVRSIAHNPYYLGNDLVVLSYYGDGVQVWDVRNPAAPSRLAYFDTTPDGSGYNNGVWGVYPFLPSGNILGSDVFTGLYVLSIDNLQVLPVDYLGWDVTTDGKHAHLEWTTSAETDNEGWDVEHALAGGDFVPVGFVPAAGTNDYVFTHENIGPGVHYYRLRQRDLTGAQTLTELRTVVIGRSATAITAYPNPAPAGSPVRLDGLDDDSDWELFHANGQRVLSGRGRMLTAKLTAGVYFLRMAGKDVGKLVVGG